MGWLRKDHSDDEDTELARRWGEFEGRREKLREDNGGTLRLPEDRWKDEVEKKPKPGDR